MRGKNRGVTKNKHETFSGTHFDTAWTPPPEFVLKSTATVFQKFRRALRAPIATRRKNYQRPQTNHNPERPKTKQCSERPKTEPATQNVLRRSLLIAHVAHVAFTWRVFDRLRDNLVFFWGGVQRLLIIADVEDVCLIERSKPPFCVKKTKKYLEGVPQRWQFFGGVLEIEKKWIFS